MVLIAFSADAVGLRKQRLIPASPACFSRACQNKDNLNILEEEVLLGVDYSR